MRQFTLTPKPFLTAALASSLFLGPRLVLAQTPDLSVVSNLAPDSAGTHKIGDFIGLESFGIRVDEVRVGEGNTLEVFVTVRNAGERLSRLTAGSIDIYLTDADGIGIRDAGNLYSAAGATPKAINDSVSIEPKDETRLRYLFHLAKGAVPVKTLTFHEGNVEPQSVDISEIKIPNAVEPGITLNSLVGGTEGFLELGPYDVRLDGVKRGRNNTLQAFFTFKNVSEKRQQFTSSDFNLRIVDNAGVGTRNIGNLYRASGGEPIGISNTVLVGREKEAKVRFVFNWKPGTTPRRLIIGTYNDAQQSYNLPQIP